MAATEVFGVAIRLQDNVSSVLKQAAASSKSFAAEVKKAKSGLPNSLWDTYSAMANCYGGMILLGVVEKEEGSFVTTGLKDVEKLQKDLKNMT